jgi:hypothetical protein
MGGDIIQLHRLAPSMGVQLNHGYRSEILMDGNAAWCRKTFIMKNRAMVPR